MASLSSEQIALRRKMHAVMVEMGRLQKDKFNDQQKYSYLSDEAIKDAVNELFGKHGLMIYPVGARIAGVHDVRESKMRTTDIEMVYELCDIETGAIVRIMGLGSGADVSDKGVYKALTGSMKYVMHNTFLLRTGADPESDGGKQGSRPASKSGAGETQRSERKQDPEAIISEAQQKRLYALANKAMKTHEEAKAVIQKHGYGSSREIRVKHYDAICAEIERQYE